MISRRAFLRGLGGLSLAVPLLQLPAGRARAASPYPRRFVVFYHPNGTLKELWSPAEVGERYTLPRLLAPLVPHQADLLVLDGIDMAVAEVGPGGPHNRGMATMLTGQIITEGNFADGDGRLSGWAGGISVDQYIARELAAPTRFTSLELGVRVIENEPRARMCYRGRDQPVPPECDPANVWSRLFAPMDGDPAQLAALIARRRSVLDVVREDFNRLDRVLAPEDRAKLGQHADALRDLERRLGLGASPVGSCAGVPAPGVMDPGSDESLPDLAKAQIDLLVMALACDLTRVASLQFASAVDTLRYTFLGIHDQDGHGLSHAGDLSYDLQEEWAQVQVWYAEQFAYLLASLKAVPEGEGTLLDNTCVLWCNELSRGNTHAHTDMPFVVAGKAGGALRPGRHLRYEAEPHNNLLLGLVQAMGLAESTFGDPDFCTRPLPDLG